MVVVLVGVVVVVAVVVVVVVEAVFIPDWSRECAAIRSGAPNFDRMVRRMCSNPSLRFQLLQIGPANVQQSVVALPIATNWSCECAAIRRSALNCDRLVMRIFSNP